MQLNQTHMANGTDKRARYGWVTKDIPGTFQQLHKDVLRVEPAYQRDVIESKVADFTAEWSWVALGVIVVGKRAGIYWVIDGQHRFLASKRRSDIILLPCMVFDTDDIQHEARGFIDANTGRKPVTALGKQKALVVAGDKAAIFVQETLDTLGLRALKNAVLPGQLACIGWCNRHARINSARFARVMAFAAELCAASGVPIPERLLDGLMYLHNYCGDGFDDARLVKRMREKGAVKLMEGVQRAAAYFVRGGAGVYADGMLSELNKGMHLKFVLTGADGVAR